jgi:hypothetical protein
MYRSEEAAGVISDNALTRIAVVGALVALGLLVAWTADLDRNTVVMAAGARRPADRDGGHVRRPGAPVR